MRDGGAAGGDVEPVAVDAGALVTREPHVHASEAGDGSRCADDVRAALFERFAQMRNIADRCYLRGEARDQGFVPSLFAVRRLFFLFRERHHT